jgi:hypothetical protein
MRALAQAIESSGLTRLRDLHPLDATSKYGHDAQCIGTEPTLATFTSGDVLPCSRRSAEE